ncbi:MAG: macro domain-containing protein [Lachnospiraceae bacterium]|nr:macro domain-containing protein [Lachnospiraceae bacterium]
MPFRTIFSDAVIYEGDAVLNSLGRKGSVYGYLCRNIIKAADSKNVKDIIDSVEDDGYGRIILTEAGKLKCKNIIHIVTPVKHLDDSQNSQLKAAYKKVIDFAVEKGFKSIGLPFIGTGANGYNEREVFRVLQDVCTEIVLKEDEENRDIIDITIIAYLKEIPDYERNYNCYRERRENERRNRYRQFEHENSLRYCMAPIVLEDESCSAVCDISDQSLKNDKLYKHAKELTKWKEEDFFVPQSDLYKRSIFEFVSDYIYENDMDEKKLVEAGFDKRRKWKMVQEHYNMTKMDVLRISYVFKMNKTVTLELMMLAGYTFSPIQPVDMFFWDYLNGKYKGKKLESLYDLDNLAYEEGVQMGSQWFCGRKVSPMDY